MMTTPLHLIRKSLLGITLSAALLLGLASCSDTDSTQTEQTTVLSLKPVSQPAAAARLKSASLGAPDVQLTNHPVNIMVGQNTNSGTITVWEIDGDANGIYDAFRIDLQLVSGSAFTGATAIYIGTSLPGSVAPGQFPYQYPTPANTSVSYTIPFAQCLPAYSGCTLDNIYILVHANINSQTGWGHGSEAPGSNWAMYFTVNLKDVTPPVVTSPAAVSLECEGEVAVIEATDVCGTATVKLESETAEGTCPKVITRTYTVSDGTNSVTFVQTITIQDKTAPTISGSISESTVEGCSAPAAVTTAEALAALGLTITDNCSGPLTVSSSDATAGSCPKVVTRTYTVSDACGNSATATQVINVTDTTAPTASDPAAINASCDNIPEPNIAVVTGASDNCSAVKITFAGDQADGSGCTYTITRTYKVEDACGNAKEVHQTINVADKTAPVLSGQGASATIACTATPVFTAPTATDNCSGATVSQVGTDLVETGTGFTRTTRTWVATDACGNVSAPVSQSITNNCGGFGGEGNPDPVASGTGWAYNSSYSKTFNSFTTSNNWGWTNGTLAQNATYKFTLYVGAGGNNLTKGTPVGDVTVTYGATSVVVTYNVVSAVKITGAHLYVGKDKLPMKKTSYLSSPGQLGNNSGTISTNTYTFTVTKLYTGINITPTTGAIYIAAHADIAVK